MAFFSWSKTAASNATADSTINWAEGQSPSSVNDSARAMMARTAEYRDDVAGASVTGGSSTAFTLVSNQVFDTLAHMNGQVVGFVPFVSSTNTVGNDVTLNVDGLGAKPIRMQPGVALPGGTLVSGTPYIVVYNNSDGVFYLRNTVDPYIIPVGGSVDWWAANPPNSSFVLMYGQAISRTTYSVLFGLIGTTHGVGDGSTTFNIPDLRGRFVAGKDNMGGSAASRLTSTYFGGNDPTVLGAFAGSQSAALGLSNMAPITPSGTINISGGNLAVINGSASGNVIAGGSTPIFSTNGGAYALIAATFTGNVGGGSSTPFSIVPPAIIANKIMRVI